MLLLKFVHVSTVFVSFLLFTLRAYSVFTQNNWHRNPFFRIIPHVNDTLLFVSALGLVVVLKQYPFIEPWLTVKVVLLLVYIILGMALMKVARSNFAKISLFVLSVLCFIYIVGVARAHNPLGIFSYFFE
jgi:uncharacterized membrane protein SirB2